MLGWSWSLKTRMKKTRRYERCSGFLRAMIARSNVEAPEAGAHSPADDCERQHHASLEMYTMEAARLREWLAVMSMPKSSLGPSGGSLDVPSSCTEIRNMHTTDLLRLSFSFDWLSTVSVDSCSQHQSLLHLFRVHRYLALWPAPSAISSHFRTQLKGDVSAGTRD